jgi:HNH endonuclease/AP2 domain
MNLSNNNKLQVTSDYVRKNLYYNPDTGDFYWLISNSNRVKVGDIAGSVKEGYRIISITFNGKKNYFLAHRLAWLYIYGVWPNAGIDHIDRNPSNNRISNLREATQQENTRNQTKRENCSSCYLGVSWYKRDKKWTARIKIGNKYHFLGYFDTEEEAALAYNRAALERDPNFNNLNVVS